MLLMMLSFLTLSLLLSTSATDSPSPTLDLMGDGNSGEWAVVVDGVMGGKSQATMSSTSSSITFKGVVSLQGGGFASIRRRLSTPVDLSSYSGILIKYSMRDPSATTGGQQPLGLRLSLRPQSLRYGFGASFAVPAVSSAAYVGGVGAAYLPLSAFTEATYGSWNCNPCVLDPTSVGEIDLYNLFQEGPFAVTIHSIVAVTEPQSNVWSDPGLNARLSAAGAIAAEIEGTIQRGAYVYDKGYEALCAALYAHTTSALLAITGGNVAGTEMVVKQVLCNALALASEMITKGENGNAAWAIRRAFDAVLAVVKAVEGGGVYTSSAVITSQPTPAPAPRTQCRLMVDVRLESDYAAENAGCTFNIPRSEFSAGQPGLNKMLALVGNDKTAAIGVHCYRGNWAGIVKTYLEAEGFTNVDNDGGWDSGDKDAILAKCVKVDGCNTNNENNDAEKEKGGDASSALVVLATNAAAEVLAASTVKALSDDTYPAVIKGGWLYTEGGSNDDLAQCVAKHSSSTAGGGSMVDGVVATANVESGIVYTYDGDESVIASSGSAQALLPTFETLLILVLACILWNDVVQLM